MPWFLHGCWVSNSGLHVYSANTLSTERSPQPPDPYLKTSPFPSCYKGKRLELNPTEQPLERQLTSLLPGCPRTSSHGPRGHYCLTLAGQVVLQGHCGLLEDWLLSHNLDLSHLEDKIEQHFPVDAISAGAASCAWQVSCAGFFPRKPKTQARLQSDGSEPNNSQAFPSAPLRAFPSKQTLQPS